MVAMRTAADGDLAELATGGTGAGGDASTTVSAGGATTGGDATTGTVIVGPIISETYGCLVAGGSGGDGAFGSPDAGRPQGDPNATATVAMAATVALQDAA